MATRLDQDKTVRQIHARALLDDDKRILVEPASAAQGFQRWRTPALAVRRVEKDKVVRLLRRRRPELARVAPQNARLAREAERLGIGPNKRAGFDTFIHEERNTRAA